MNDTGSTEHQCDHSNRVEPDLLERICCPSSHSELTQRGNYLVSESGHKYPVVRGVPVLLSPRPGYSIGITALSLDTAESHARGKYSGQFIETIAVTPKERAELESEFSGHPGILPWRAVAAKLAAATNGRAFKGWQRTAPPIPKIPIPQGDGGTLLDVGCSWGRWTIAAALHGYRSIGIDPSLGAVLAAKDRAREMGVDAQFVVGDARSLPFKKASIDGCWSFSVLQHLDRQDLPSAFAEISRITRSKSRLTVQMPCVHGPLNTIHRIRRRGRKEKDFEVRYYSVSALRSALAKHWEAVEVTPHCWFGIGLLECDLPHYGPIARNLLRMSEVLRNVSSRVPFIARTADSHYYTALRSQASPGEWSG